MTARRAVFRALVGGYERLREEPVAAESGVPFICVTDDPTLTSSTWQLVVAPPRFPADSTRSARALKILGHPVVDDFDEVLWIDNTVELTRPPDALFEEWLDGVDVAAPLHSYRTSVLTEAEAVIAAGFDDYARVYEQLTHYLAVCPDVLEENPHWTGLYARRRTEATAAAMQTWWEQVLRYSRRDQLSFMVAMRAHDVRLRSLPLDNFASDWHAWPRAEGRDPGRLGTGLRAALQPVPARVSELELALDDATRRLDDVTRTLTASMAQRDADLRRVEADLAEVRGHVGTVEAELARVGQDRDSLRVRLREVERRERQLLKRLARKQERLVTARRALQRLRKDPARRSTDAQDGSPRV